MPARPSLILASTSRYRRALLERLALPFQAVTPDVDETRLPNEPPEDMVVRLAAAKAAEVANRFPGALVIGSDQCAALGADVLGKPGSHEKARAQLGRLSGQRVTFHTGLCVIDGASGREWRDVVPFTVHMRDLEPDEIERYLRADQPYDCAGSFKSEGLGISLFRAMAGDDPTALVGLPLIRLCARLREAGLTIPAGETPAMAFNTPFDARDMNSV
jgi:septum formation protein